MKSIVSIFVSVLFASSASADVVDVAPGGFEVKSVMHVAAAPEKVYDALVQPSHWWNSEHTFSHNAANLTLDARAGGCWCETLPNGSVEHLVVVYADRPKVLRLKGALGPLQGLAVDGVFTWSMKPDKDGTELAMDYRVGGYVKEGFADWSNAVDGVLSGQLARLKLYIETGSPEMPKR
ncbi:MAG TPA: SRPBCC family protein [Rhizomicrobium sp.]|jgi:uncharacterized protein YndB with AHSA1/START domain|nr:SRPBCC family protein [Rhizomicrobium sp.]